MSEEQRNQSRENDYPRRPPSERDGKRQDGFEGMNFEQRRQPYRRPQQSGNPAPPQDGKKGNDQQP